MPLADMSRVADEVTAVTDRHGGFVLSSSVDTGRDGGDGDFSLRIPAAEVRPALRDLAGLAPVISQSQEGRDVTRQHVTAKDRLQAARAERRSLLRRLGEAQTDAEAEAIRRRLDLVSGEISGLRAQLRDLRLRTDYAVVTVHLVASERDGGATGAPLGDAFDDAGGLLVGLAGVLIRVLALAIPLGRDRPARLAGGTFAAPPAARVGPGVAPGPAAHTGGRACPDRATARGVSRFGRYVRISRQAPGGPARRLGRPGPGPLTRAGGLPA